MQMPLGAPVSHIGVSGLSLSSDGSIQLSPSLSNKIQIHRKILEIKMSGKAPVDRN